MTLQRLIAIDRVLAQHVADAELRDRARGWLAEIAHDYEVWDAELAARSAEARDGRVAAPGTPFPAPPGPSAGAFVVLRHILGEHVVDPQWRRAATFDLVDLGRDYADLVGRVTALRAAQLASVSGPSNANPILAVFRRDARAAATDPSITPADLAVAWLETWGDLGVPGEESGPERELAIRVLVRYAAVWPTTSFIGIDELPEAA